MLVAIIGKGRSMDLKEAVSVAKRCIEALFAAEAPQDVRLEGFLYDDHLMIWSLTIGFALSNDAQDALNSARHARSYKIVRVSETDKTVLSVRDG
jgi:hypothetical protein